jgi:hypothetical protein
VVGLEVMLSETVESGHQPPQRPARIRQPHVPALSEPEGGRERMEVHCVSG